MAVLEPKLAILDETDSGLDIDALKLVANGVNAMRSPERAIIVVTHYQRLLDYIVPDFVHVLSDGRIVQVRRQGAGARAREEGLRLDRDRRAAGRSMSAMTQVVETTSALARRRRTARRTGAALAAGSRAIAAASRFRALGFPTVRDEDWRFTNIAPIASAEFRPTGADAAHARPKRSSPATCTATRRTASSSSTAASSPELSRAARTARPASASGSLAAAVTEQADIVQRYLGQLADFGDKASRR